MASGELAFGLAVTEAFSIREEAGIELENDTLRGKAMMALDAHGADYLLLAIGNDRLAVIVLSATCRPSW